MLLRYLADAYRALRQTVPAERRTEELEEIIEWLGRAGPRHRLEPARRVGAAAQPAATSTAPTPPAAPTTTPRAPITANPRAFRALVRNALFRRVELAARERYGGAGARSATSTPTAPPWDADRWRDALDPYFDDHDEILTGARRPRTGPVPGHRAGAAARWQVRQLLDDPAGDHDWRIDAVVDLAASDEAGDVQLRIVAVGPLGDLTA